MYIKAVTIALYLYYNVYISKTDESINCKNSLNILYDDFTGFLKIIGFIRFFIIIWFLKNDEFYTKLSHYAIYHLAQTFKVGGDTKNYKSLNILISIYRSVFSVN